NMYFAGSPLNLPIGDRQPLHAVDASVLERVRAVVELADKEGVVAVPEQPALTVESEEVHACRLVGDDHRPSRHAHVGAVGAASVGEAAVGAGRAHRPTHRAAVPRLAGDTVGAAAAARLPAHLGGGVAPQ